MVCRVCNCQRNRISVTDMMVHTSFRNNKIIMKQKVENPAETAHGRKYGNLVQKGCENTSGHRS